MLDPNGPMFWVAFAVLFPLLFVSLWVIVLLVVSRMSGWNSLAERFRYDSWFDGEVWKWQSGRMRWCNYNGCMKLGANSTGLYLGLIPPFRFFSPTLLVPWEEVSVSRGQMLLFSYVQLALGRELKVPLKIRPRLAEKLRAAAGLRWPVETVG